MRIELYNEFHGTRTFMVPAPDGTVSRRALLRAERMLCPYTGCTCHASAASGVGVTLITYALPADQFGDRWQLVPKA